jgi:hypothetical protein
LIPFVKKEIGQWVDRWNEVQVRKGEMRRYSGKIINNNEKKENPQK